MNKQTGTSMEYCLELKRSELSSHRKTGVDPKCRRLSERSQSENAMYYIIPTIQHSGKGKAKAIRS